MVGMRSSDHVVETTTGRVSVGCDPGRAVTRSEEEPPLTVRSFNRPPVPPQGWDSSARSGRRGVDDGRQRRPVLNDAALWLPDDDARAAGPRRRPPVFGAPPCARADG